MAKGNDITKKQHYIPQVYLRGFASDNELPMQKNKEIESTRIHCYDLVQHKVYKDIPIKTICYEKNLYEVTDGQGNYILPNYLEKVLSQLEGMFANYRKALKGKAYIKENYNTKCFLSREEKVFWITYISIQLMRSPEILKLAEETSQETWKNDINSEQAKNLARLVCLPFFKELNEESMEAKLWDTIMGPMFNMSFSVCVDNKASFITSDNPVYLYSKTFPCEEYEKIIFPVSSDLCLILIGGDEKKEYAKNFLFPASKDVRKMIFSAQIDNAHVRVYSSYLFGAKEMTWINEVMTIKGEKEIHHFEGA